MTNEAGLEFGDMGAPIDNEKRLRKALGAYFKAQGDLIKLRNELYPVGSQVILMGVQRTVTAGSLYADQLFLDGKMHTGFHHVTRTKDLK